MKILAIESSCDETSAAVVECGEVFEVKSNIIASQIDIHKLYGGVVPEIASRKHIECISQVVDEALATAEVAFKDIDAIAVTYAPGLVGALLVGVNYAKSLAYALDIPLIAVHHIEGHICANYIDNADLKPPFMCLVASGGHSTIVKVKSDSEYQIMARTRDDAAGEAFDKIARVLGLGYPGGPVIQNTAKNGNPEAFAFPRVSFDDSYDFSFSGVKTSVINMIHKLTQQGNDVPVSDIAASFQYCVCDVLAKRLVQIAKAENIKTITLAGGVAANSLLRELLLKYSHEEELDFYYPKPVLCTDNAAMIAVRGYFMLINQNVAKTDLNAVATKDL